MRVSALWCTIERCCAHKEEKNDFFSSLFALFSLIVRPFFFLFHFISSASGAFSFFVTYDSAQSTRSIFFLSALCFATFCLRSALKMSLSSLKKLDAKRECQALWRSSEQSSSAQDRTGELHGSAASTRINALKMEEKKLGKAKQREGGRNALVRLNGEKFPLRSAHAHHHYDFYKL